MKTGVVVRCRTDIKVQKQDDEHSAKACAQGGRELCFNLIRASIKSPVWLSGTQASNDASQEAWFGSCPW